MQNTPATTRPRPTLYDLLNGWNEATNPYEPRTDAEHAAHNARARELEAQIRSRYTFGREYRELSNGMRVPTAEGVAAQEAAWCNEDRQPATAPLSLAIIAEEEAR